MLASLLLMFGFVPQGAAQNPCLFPGWVVEHKVAVACDLADVAKPKEGEKLKLPIIGKRSGEQISIGFLRVTPTMGGQKPIAYTINPQGSEAQSIAMLIGPNGGVVNPQRGVTGTGSAWVADTGSLMIDSSKQSGIVVKAFF